jgi:protein CsiD
MSTLFAGTSQYQQDNDLAGGCMPQAASYTGFNIQSHTKSPRLKVVTLDASTISAFQAETQQWGVQALEYKPFLRFAIANQLNQCCGGQLQDQLQNIIHDRASGAFLLQFESPKQGAVTEQDSDTDFYVKLSTAVSHLIGLSNFDSMGGKYYARVTVKNDDSSDSYLRQAHRRMELHNDGTYVNERTDYVLMMKMAEKNMEGGNSLILHLEDWQDLNTFVNDPVSQQDIEWSAPPSKQVQVKVYHPVFFEKDDQGLPHMLFIDQFANPKNMQQGLYLHKMGESLEAEQNCISVPVPVGSMLVIHNHRWLHGREQFMSNPGLERELLRQRGHFTE